MLNVRCPTCNEFTARQGEYPGCAACYAANALKPSPIDAEAMDHFIAHVNEQRVVQFRDSLNRVNDVYWEMRDARVRGDDAAFAEARRKLIAETENALEVLK